MKLKLQVTMDNENKILQVQNNNFERISGADTNLWTDFKHLILHEEKNTKRRETN